MGTLCFRVYLDYNATTPLEGEVLDAIQTALKDAWANPSSTYAPGKPNEINVNVYVSSLISP